MSLEESPMKPLYEILRERRRVKKLSQSRVAYWSGMTQGNLSKFERGKHDPRLSTAYRVAAALGIQFVAVPRELVSTVQALIANHDANSRGEPVPAEQSIVPAEVAAMPPAAQVPAVQPGSAWEPMV